MVRMCQLVKTGIFFFEITPASFASSINMADMLTYDNTISTHPPSHTHAHTQNYKQSVCLVVISFSLNVTPPGTLALFA